MRYAMMNDNDVLNVAEWDGETPWEPGCEIVALDDSSPVGPGWTRDGDKWTAPEPTPEQAAMLKALTP